MISETIVFLLEELFYLYTCYLFFDSFFETVRTNRIVLFLTYLALFVVDGKYLLFDDVMPNPIFNILFFFLITMHYEASYKKRMVMVFLFYASLGAVETVMMTLTSNHLADVQQHGYTNPFGTLFINLICFILVLILRNFKNIRSDIKVPASYWACTLFLPTGSVWLLVTVVGEEKIFSQETQVAVSALLIFLINLVTFYLYDRIKNYYNDKMKAELLRQENRYYSLQFDNIMEHMEQIRAFRHDFRNHLEVLDSLLESRPDEAREYITSLTGVISAGKQYAKTGNIPIDSIINYKLAKAQEHQIEIETELAVPVELRAEPSDMVVILGNLLDNAINASLKIPQGRKIIFRMVYAKGVLNIHISNTYNGVVVYEKNHIKTTSGSEEYHGYGLKNVEAALKKYNGQQRISHDDHWFQVEIIMYIEEIS